MSPTCGARGTQSPPRLGSALRLPPSAERDWWFGGPPSLLAHPPKAGSGLVSPQSLSLSPSLSVSFSCLSVCLCLPVRLSCVCMSLILCISLSLSVSVALVLSPSLLISHAFIHSPPLCPGLATCSATTSACPSPTVADCMHLPVTCLGPSGTQAIIPRAYTEHLLQTQRKPHTLHLLCVSHTVDRHANINVAATTCWPGTTLPHGLGSLMCLLCLCISDSGFLCISHLFCSHFLKTYCALSPTPFSPHHPPPQNTSISLSLWLCLSHPPCLWL